MDATRGRAGARALGLGGAALLAVALAAGPAAASHDDHTAGTVVIRVGPGSDRVVVVRDLDADVDALREEVRSAAAEADIAVRDVQVRENSDPDTQRAVVDAPLSVRDELLAWQVPAAAVDAWRPLGEVVVEPDDWVEGVSGTPAEGEGITYRVDPLVFVLALGISALAAVIPFALLRWYGGRVLASDGDRADRVHRLRRVTTAVQLSVPVVLAGALVIGGLQSWAVLGLAVLTGVASLPAVLDVVVGVAGMVVPLLLAFVGAALGALPADRQLRDTGQSARQGASQAVRGLALGLLPVLVWVTVLPLLADDLGPWGVLPVALLFAVGVAAAMPVLIARTQATGELDPAVRDRVLEQCRAAGLAVRDVKLLSSQGSRTANAAIAGIVPPLRYVFLTDELLDTMDQEEVRAVVAHEIAHGKEHHILLKMAAGFVAIGVVAGLVLGVLRGFLDDVPGPAIALGMPLLVIGALLFAHGVVGIRLEQRADGYAARQTDPEVLASALEKLASANGIKRRTGWWWNVLQQHPGLDGRLRRLREGRGAASART